MPKIPKTDRGQLTFTTLECEVAPDSTARLIDLFIEKIDLARLGFRIREDQHEGRPSFEEATFLALYLYGYIHGVRSSRRLERECLVNVEVRWLIGTQAPNYHSIADFRKDNPGALRNTFRLFLDFLKQADLVGGRTVAVDGTKIRASNSRKRNFTAGKIAEQLARIEKKTEEYLNTLDDNDRLDAQQRPPRFSDKNLDRLRAQALRYEVLEKRLEKSGDTQISLTDPDSRSLPIRGTETAVSYNTQAVVDEKHNLVVAQDTLNTVDRNALHDMGSQAKANLGAHGLTLLADKGYHNGEHLHRCAQNGITTLCAPPETVNSNPKGTTREYLADKFYYDTKKDTYICPAGRELATNGTWYTKKNRKGKALRYKKYNTPHCQACPFKKDCTARKDGREIERSEYAEAVDANHIRYHNNPELYRKRQMMNEHIFGTIKRKWGYSYTDLRGLEKVRGEMALIYTVYNLRRCITILGTEKMMEMLRNWEPGYPPTGPNGPNPQKGNFRGRIEAPKITDLKMAA